MTSVESYNIDDLEPLLVTLKNTLGVVVADEQRSDLVERIEPLLSTYKLDSLASLADRIRGDQGDEIKTGLLEAVSQSQSSWSLSAEIRGILRNYIFEQLPEKARVWIVGCQQGQLAYSVAMELAKHEHENDEHKNIEIIATDISQGHIDYAQKATYSKQQLHGLSDENKKQFVTMNETGDYGQIKGNIRQLLSFGRCDLTKDFQSLGAMDLIICPDVLVYFSNDIKAGIFRQFSALLKSGGIFLTDNSQAIMTTVGGLERVEHPAGIFYRKKG
ncbi:MAG: methyltransferase [Gammaproteobacteria bacterium]|jgi:chemotaxis protein methyltransferase CheR|nr:methyltransferase [Gammaproteobacteria bacterium]